MAFGSATSARAEAAVGTVELVEFRELPLGDALRVLSQQTGLNIVASSGAAARPVSLYLTGVSAVDALDALCKAHDLWFREDLETGIYRVYTTDEYQRDLITFREERSRVFTLLYPNSLDVAVAIRDLFGDRVRLSFGVDDEEYLEELEQRFERFDLLDERSQGLGFSEGRSNRALQASRSRNRGTDRGRSSGLLTSALNNRIRTVDPGDRRDVLDDLTPEEIEALEGLLAGEAGGEDAEMADAILSQRANIFVTVIRRHNKLVVRTSDADTMLQIAELVQRLDVPTPMLLLEVKVLSIELGDGFESAFDFQFQTGGDLSGGFLPTNGDPITESTFNSFFFQVLGGNVQAQMQLLETKAKVTTLASPLLLTANNEVSRLFIGRQIPVTTGFTQATTVVNQTQSQVVEPTPETQLEDIGTNLLITPNINADRTVTLRVIQERTQLIEDGATIPFVRFTPTGDSNQVDVVIDVVAQESVSGTIMARDGNAVIIGGLIEEGVRDRREQVPILGDIPLLGLLFRSQESESFRRETVVMIRPYVMSTPVDSDALSRALLEDLSIHPNRTDFDNTLDVFTEEDVLGPENRTNEFEKLFQFHNEPEPEGTP